MKSVIQKVQCVKIDKYYFRNIKGRILKYSDFVDERIVKQNLLIIIKISIPNIVLNIKKKTWLMLKEVINCVKSVNHLIKQNVLPQNVNIQLKNIKQL